MNRLAKFIVDQSRLAWVIAGIAILAAALGAAYLARDAREGERISLLRMEAARHGVELMSQTLNGSLMGSVAMLGLLEEDIKRDARGEGAVNTPGILGTLESITRAYAAQGVFVVGTDGVIRSSWDSNNKPSTGLNVKFRPYFKMAMQGKENVYAAVSLARGDRALYFSSPVYATPVRSDKTTGAVVARTDSTKIDAMLRDRSDIALLLSPQGVVFASSRPEWVGFLAGEPTPERLQAIRELKQFGNMFENKAPSILPLSVGDGRSVLEGRRFAVASTPVVWNDPFGDWKLVLLEDLSRTVPLGYGLRAAAGVAVLLLALVLILFHLLRSHHGQWLAALQVETYAKAQQRGAERKSQLAAAALRMQQANSVGELAKDFLTEAHQLLGALQGVIYAANDDADGVLRLAGSYACGDDVPAELAPGEGLLGQCAVERMTRVVETPMENRWTIRSGLGNTRPAALLMAPVLLQDKLLGVVELATLKVPGEETRQQFDDMVGLLGMNLEIVRRSQRTEELLSNTVAAERAKAEQLTFQQALVDTIPYPVFYKDADTRFLGFNRAYEECFGVRRETLVGKRVLDLDYLPEADRLAYQAEDEATIASADSVKREMQMPFADGKVHDTLYFVSSFRRADGSPGGLVGTFIDITEMKQAQNELARLSDAERFNRLARGREARVLELKREVNSLCQRLSELPRYGSASLDPEAGDLPELPLGENLKLVHLNWHPAYDCGQADIDREHHTLFAIANDLLNAIVARKPPETIGGIINQLVQETTQHFEHEVAILRAQGYDHVEEHAAIHRELIDKAVHLIGEFKAGKVEAGPFFQFLAYDVIARHMLGEDRKFFPLFQSATEGAGASALPAASASVPGLAELVDLDELQKLFSAFCESVGIAAAIIDLDAKVLASSRWQRACTDFHRVNPESCARCIESDTSLALKLEDGQDFTMYKCKNGMTDCASPIIVEGHHLANVFIGQFHLGPPDMEFFRQQARQFGYPEAEYLQAIADAPVADEKRLPVILGFLSGFARMVSSMSLARRRADETQQRLQQQAAQLHRERVAALSLAEDAEQARIALAAISKESQA